MRSKCAYSQVISLANLSLTSFFLFLVKTGNYITAGARLGIITDYHGNELETIVALIRRSATYPIWDTAGKQGG